LVNPQYVQLFTALVVLLVSIQACISPSRSSGDFVASQEGQLVFEDFSSTGDVWYKMDFSGAVVKTEILDKPEPGILSRDGEWVLFLVREQDTNNDSIVNQDDLSSLYLARAGSPERKRVDVPFPVGICTWGAECIIVACSFASGDVGVNSNNASGSNGVIYLVDLESGELLRQLSDPTKSSWLPIWSPDGSMIAFGRGIETKNGIEPKYGSSTRKG
jgi:Tol biopolymer transport system component